MLLQLIRSLMRGETPGISMIINFFAIVFVVFCTLPVHEFAHAWAANKLGDDTARLQGRLTLSPLAHLDPIGALMIFLVGFGYAKPVPVNPRRFKNPKAGMAITAAAGPASNLLMALIFLFLRHGADLWLAKTGSIVAQVTELFFYFAASVNVSLAVFNLLPIPPLDGSRVVSLVLPTELYFKIMQYERYIRLVIFALLLMGWLTAPLSFLSTKLLSGFDWLTGLPFRAFLS
ncbi:MAG: site-2 protease family protein [Clostridia bacterium]|nr:site-2 protease family protein [Clostridia bacterium]